MSHTDFHFAQIAQAVDETAARAALKAANDHLEADVPPAGAAPPQRDLRARALRFLSTQYAIALEVRLRELRGPK